MAALIETVLRGDEKRVKELMQISFEPDWQNTEGHTALFVACQRGSVNIIKSLLDGGAHPEIRAYDGTVALHHAVTGDEPYECTKVLLGYGVDPNPLDRKGNSVLSTLANHSDDFKTTRLLLANNAIDVYEKGLEAATAKNHVYVASLLRLAALQEKGNLTLRASVTLDGKEGNDSLQVVTQALETDGLGVLYQRDQAGRTPLLQAAEHGYTDTVHLLLELGADINAKNNNGDGALYLAGANLQLDTFRLLQERGAPSFVGKTSKPLLDITTSAEHLTLTACVLMAGFKDYTQNAYEIADQANNPPLFRLVKNGVYKSRAVAEEYLTSQSNLLLQAIRSQNTSRALELLAAGCNPNAVDEATGNTALHLAIKIGDEKVTAALLEHYADDHVENNNGVTPWAQEHNLTSLQTQFIISYKKRQAAAVSLPEYAWTDQVIQQGPVFISEKLNAGADINARDTSGETVLCKVSRGGGFELVKTLVDANADVNAGGKHGTPILFAAEAGDIESLKYLIKAGANINAIAPVDKENALAKAIRGGQDGKFVKTLLKLGAYDWNGSAARAALDTGFSLSDNDIQLDGAIPAKMLVVPGAGTYLWVSCRNLPQKDVNSHSDPYVRVYAKDEDDGKFSHKYSKLIGETEVIQDTHHPDFTTKIVVPSGVGTIKFVVYELDGAAKPKKPHSKSILGEYFLDTDQTIQFDVEHDLHKHGKSSVVKGEHNKVATISFHPSFDEEAAKNKPVEFEYFDIWFACSNIAKMDKNSESDGIIILWGENSDGDFKIDLGRTEIINDNKNPVWDTKLTVPKSAGRVKASVYDSDRKKVTKKGLIGDFIFDAADIPYNQEHALLKPGSSDTFQKGENGEPSLITLFPVRPAMDTCHEDYSQCACRDVKIGASKSGPVQVDLSDGADKYICRCGLSATWPFCDGSHLKQPDPNLLPLVLNKAGHGEDYAYICTCGHSKCGRMCDGSHNKIKPLHKADKLAELEAKHKAAEEEKKAETASRPQRRRSRSPTRRGNDGSNTSTAEHVDDGGLIKETKDHTSVKVHEHKKENVRVLKLTVVNCVNLTNMDGKGGESDPYVKVLVKNKSNQVIAEHKTKVVKNQANPKYNRHWDFTPEVDDWSKLKEVVCEVWDQDKGKPDDLIGTYIFNLQAVDGHKEAGAFPLTHPRSDGNQGRLKMVLQYASGSRPKKKDPFKVHKVDIKHLEKKSIKSSDGLVSREELLEMLESLHMPDAKEHVNDFFAFCGSDLEHGRVKADEFIAMYKRMCIYKTVMFIEYQFGDVDVDGDGKISKAELSRILAESVGAETAIEMTDTMFAIADADRNGALSLQEIKEYHNTLHEKLIATRKAQGRG